MKNLILICIVCHFTLTTFSQAPVACYPFSGNANDSSGNGHHGIVNGAVLTSDRFVNTNSAYLFDGIDDYISLGNYGNIIPSGNNFSLSVWIQANQLKSQTILMVNPDNNADRFNAMAYHSHTGISSTFWDYGNIANNGRLSIIGTTFNSAWEHYTFVVNSSQNYMEVYKNGVLQLNKPSSSVFVNRNRELRIGGAFDTNFDDFFFDGKIDDMAIYNYALSAAQVQSLFANPINCLGFVSINENLVEDESILTPTISNNGHFQLLLGNSENKINFIVFDYSGKQVAIGQRTSSQNTIHFDFSSLSSGAYFLKIIQENFSKNFKFLIH